MIRFVLLFIIGLSLSFPAIASDGNGSLFQYDLPRLKSKTDFLTHKDQATAIVVFQPHCAWCLAQFRLMNKLAKQDNLKGNYIAVGINGKRQDLLREYARSHSKLPAFKSTPNFYRTAKLDKATPVILVLNKQGQIIKKLKGYQDEIRFRQIDQLLSLLNEQAH